MRALAAIFLFVITFSPSGAQQSVSKQTPEPPVPKRPCRYQRIAVLRRVKADPPIEDLVHFDLSVLTDRRIFFPVGTVVSVSRQEGGWSCATGPMGPSSGWPFRTGWTRTDLLGPFEEGDSGSGPHR